MSDQATTITDLQRVDTRVDETRVGEWARFRRSLFRNPGARIGFVLVVLLIFVSIFAPWLAPHDPFKMGVGPKLEPPGTEFWLGTDEFGRDLLSRMIYGARLTLIVGIVAVGISATIGVLVGLTAGYAGSLVENVLMRGIDVLFSFTDFLIALATVAILGPSLQNAIIAVGIAGTAFYARVVHSAVLVEREKDYFLATEAVGAGHIRLIFRHLLPNVASPLLIIGTLGVATAILNAAGLSFLGLGAQPPSPEWGAMLSAGRQYLTRAPWVATFPGIAIALVVLGFNLFGDGIREAIDPTQRRQRG